MKKILQNSLGFDIPILIYESVEEGDKAAGKPGAVLAECNKNLAYRGALKTARSLIADAIETVTGIKRPTAPVMEDYAEENGEKKQRQVKEKDGTPVVEFVGPNGSKYSEAEYVKLAVASSGKTYEALEPAVVDYILKELAEEAAKTGQPAPAGIAVDIKETERAAPKPKTLPAKFKASAEGLLNTPSATDPKLKKIDVWAKDYAKVMGAPLAAKNDKGEWDVEKVGWAVKAFLDKKEADQLAALGGK